MIPQSAALRLGVDFPVEALDQIEASSVDPVKGIASEWRAKIAAKDKGAAVSQFGAMLEACDETNPFKVWRTTTTG